MNNETIELIEIFYLEILFGIFKISHYNLEIF